MEWRSTNKQANSQHKIRVKNKNFSSAAAASAFIFEGGMPSSTAESYTRANIKVIS